MISPDDVAKFLAKTMVLDDIQEEIFEICGPEDLSSLDVARIFSDALNNEISVLHIPKQEWKVTLSQSGFSQNGVKNLIQMISSVINGKARGENPHPIRLQSDFDTYLKKKLIIPQADL